MLVGSALYKAAGDAGRQVTITDTRRRSDGMNKLSDTVAHGFIHAYRDYAQRVRALSEKLSEEQFWTKPYPYGNSFGHLTLHIIGNLNYYIGA